MNIKWIEKTEFFNKLNNSLSISQLFKSLGFSTDGIHKRTIERYNKHYNCDIKKKLYENKIKYKEDNKKTYTCKQCGKQFTEKYSKYSSGDFCSLSCAHRYSRSFISKELQKNISNKVKKYYKINPHPNTGKPSPRKGQIIRVDWKCPMCGKIIKLIPSEAKKRKFCSGTCRNIHNNKNICGQTSKAENLLYNEIIKNFPKLNVIKNDRKTLNGLELDIYIPELKLGIEWNGIFHYKDVRKNNSLEKIQKKDVLKEKLCKDMNIDLIVVKDLTSNKKFALNEINKIVKYIKEKAEW